MQLKPSFQIIIDAVKVNKISCMQILAFDILQAFCENGILIFTYFTIAYIQSNSILEASKTFKGGKFLLNFFNNIGIEINILLFLIIMVFFAFIQSICIYLERLNIAKICAWLSEKVNINIGEAILYGNYQNVSSYKSGKILNASLNSPDILASTLKIYADLIVAFIYLGVYSRLLISISFKEFGLSIITISIFALVQIYTQKKVLKRGKITNDSKSKLGNNVSEILRGIKYLKSNGSENFIKNRLLKTTKIFKNNFVKERSIVEVSEPLTKFIGIFILASIVFIFSLFEKNNLIIPTLAIFVVALQRFIGKAQTISNLNNSYNFFKSKLFIYDEIIINYNKITNKKFTIKNNKKNNCETIEDIKEIEFSNLFFKFDGENNWNLKNVNFHISTGQISSFVGRSGSGKSTLLGLICGLLKYQKGKYLINQKNINSLNGITNKFISYTSQDPYLISGSISENIIWDQNPNYKRALECLKIIDSINLLDSLKDGLNTIIGEGALSLSSGQSQLIAIARAIYKDSKIMIFDEATNALDTKSEEKIFKLLKKISKNKIIIIVSHQLENLKISDNIYLLGKGKVFKQNSFDELLKNYSNE